jgi:hypothetical protein
VLRHTALFRLRETTTPSERKAMLEGLARLFDECPSVLSGDFGAALPGGAGYDLALHLDFDDAEGYAAYVAHPTHVAVAAFNATLTAGSNTARVDWRYDGPARVNPSGVRHCEAFVWAAGADSGARPQALDAALRLGSEPGVVSVAAAVDSGSDPRAFDWILDVELADASAAGALLEGAAYRELSAALAGAVDQGRTARITHLERPG